MTMQIVFALIPMALGLAGAAFDEWTRLGFSAWRTACRDGGLTLSSLFTFTLQLLPTAVAGVLVGGLAVSIAGAIRREVRAAALAGHGGCILGMAAGVPLCLLALPLPLVLAVETLLTAAAARALFIAGKCAVGLISTKRRADRKSIAQRGGEQDECLECRG